MQLIVKKKKIRLYVSLWENYPTSYLNYYHSKQLPNEFMVSNPSFKSSLIQHDVKFVNAGPI